MTSWVRIPVRTANKTMGDSKIKFILIYGTVDNNKSKSYIIEINKNKKGFEFPPTKVSIQSLLAHKF